MMNDEYITFYSYSINIYSKIKKTN
jgi:hypothetical protein